MRLTATRAGGSPSTRQPGETIQFATFPHSWLYLRSIGELPERLVPIDRGQPNWYVLQNRPGAFSDADRALAAQGRPAYTVTKLGVPLIWIFPYSEFYTTERASPNSSSEHSDRTLKRCAPRPTGLFGVIRCRACV